MIRKTVSFIVTVILVLTLLFVICSCDKTIEFDKSSFYLPYKDGFKVLQFANVHVGSPSECDEAFEELDKLVQAESPDLIVLTGDNISYYADEGTFEKLIEHMENYAIPWAPVFGNYDDEQKEELGITKAYMASAFEGAEHCLFNSGPNDIHGVGNYVINLVNDKQTKIAYSIILMDSNTYRDYGGTTYYDYIYPDQIDWYSDAIKSIAKQNHGADVTSFAFFHIPLPEFDDAMAIQLGDGSLGWGVKGEEMGAPLNNTGFFDKIKELGSTKAVFCGHAHINNCDLLYQGVHLICGLKSSRCGYYSKDLLGCTKLTLDNNEFFVENVLFV